MKSSSADGALPIEPPDSLTATRDSNIAILRLSQHAKRNVLMDETVIGLQNVSLQLPADIRVVVLHAEGVHFSAGLDPSEAVHAADSHQDIVHSQTGAKSARRSNGSGPQNILLDA